ncbi:hypothetical protein TNCV_4441961 [Trichonephila clavipes]|nr:hypothetical protein TNCV_4441961 [Trichonephila clavipes]
MFEAIYPFVDLVSLLTAVAVLRLHATNNLSWFPTFRKQKANHWLPFLLGADRQGSCHVEWSTDQRLREKMTETLGRSVADYPSFSVGYCCQPWKEKLLKSRYFSLYNTYLL